MKQFAAILFIAGMTILFGYARSGLSGFSQLPVHTPQPVDTFSSQAQVAAPPVNHYATDNVRSEEIIQPMPVKTRYKKPPGKGFPVKKKFKKKRVNKSVSPHKGRRRK